MVELYAYRLTPVGLTQIKLHNAIIMIISKRRAFRLIHKYKRYIICEIYIRVGDHGTVLLKFISVSVHAIAYANEDDSSSINTKLLLCSLRWYSNTDDSVISAKCALASSRDQPFQHIITT